MQDFEFLLVNVTVWLACLCWLLGSIARLLDHLGNPASPRTTIGKCYGWFWLTGSILMGIHIAASYGFVHQWDHAAALEATALESELVTGIRAPWGVYFNLVFTILWTGYSVWMVRRGRRALSWFDSAFFAFSLLMMFSATVIFEFGIIRYVGLAGATALACTAMVASASVPRSSNASSEESLDSREP